MKPSDLEILQLTPEMQKNSLSRAEKMRRRENLNQHPIMIETLRKIAALCDSQTEKDSLPILA